MSDHPLCSEDQLARLQSHVQHAYATVPYYRSLYDGAGVSPSELNSYEDLMRLPTINKQAIIEAQQTSPPLGSISSSDADPPAHIYCNAGSEYLYYSPSDFESIVAMFADQFAVMGVRSSDIVDISSTFHWVMAGTIMGPAMRRLGASLIAGGPGMSELRMKIMRETGVTALEIFTPYAEELASRFEQYGIDPVADLGVRLLIIGGELRSKDSKATLEASWGGVAAREFYGVSEAGMVACECFEVGDGMHLSPYAVLEIIDPDTGRHVAPGEPGEVVTTELYRGSQPFIRYRSGDITEGIVFEQCACGRTTPRLKRIIGRNSDIARVKGQFLSPAVMDQIVAKRTEVDHWQVVLSRSQRTDDMLLRLRRRDGALEQPASVTQAIVDEIKGVVGVTCTVEIVSAEALPEDAVKIHDERVY